MPAVSAEALLISALVNTSGVGTEIQLRHLRGRLRGLPRRVQLAGQLRGDLPGPPGRDVFKHKFSGFTISAHTDIRSACDMVHQAANKRRITDAMSDAVDLCTGDAEAAYEVLRLPPTTSSSPATQPADRHLPPERVGRRSRTGSSCPTRLCSGSPAGSGRQPLVPVRTPRSRQVAHLASSPTRP